MMAKAYNGTSKLKAPPHIRAKYNGKNDAGGRKCVFSTPREYLAGSRRIIKVDINGSIEDPRYLPSGITSIATPWFGWNGHNGRDGR